MTGAYEHTQRGLLHWLLLAIGALFVLLAYSPRLEATWMAWLFLGIAVLTLLLSFCFARLTVRDTGGELTIRFGPLGLFGTRVRYTDIVAAEAGRTALIDGWGVHWVPGRGWTWNLHGFGCAKLTLRDGNTLRIGTDEPEALAGFVRSRIA